MESRFHDELEGLTGWLFSTAPERFYAQVGYANAAKKAMIWLPGRKTICDQSISWGANGGTFGGCTQGAWEDFRSPMQSQAGCFIAWLGYDVDLDTLEAQLQVVRALRDSDLPWSIRSSAGGTGLHLLLRLESPVFAPTGFQGAFTKSLGTTGLRCLEDLGVRVCSSGFRMFWLVGGENRWIHQTDEFYPTPVLTPGPTDLRNPPALSGLEHKPLPIAGFIRDWLDRFQEAGVVRGGKIGGNPVYVGSAIEVLRQHHEQVHTKSPCSGDGNINGFLDIQPTSISLWSYADGHTIWKFDEGCL